MQTKEDVETVEGKGGLKMKIEELKTMINELELEEVVGSERRKKVRFDEMLKLARIKTRIDSLLIKAESDYQSAFVIDSEEDLKGNKGATTRMAMTTGKDKYVVSIILRDDSVIDVETFKCLLEATDFEEQIDYMLSDKEGRKLLRQDLGSMKGDRL